MSTNIKGYETLADNITFARLYAGINVLDTNACWNWTGTKTDGYGVIVKQINNKKYTMFTHRLSWLSQNGKIPNGMVIDHTCHTANIDNCKGDCKHRSCINPAHLRVVSIAENLRIKRANSKAFDNLPYERAEVTGTCRKGHIWKEGSYIVARNRRDCIACRKASNARSAAKAKAGVK